MTLSIFKMISYIFKTRDWNQSHHYQQGTASACSQDPVFRLLLVAVRIDESSNMWNNNDSSIAAPYYACATPNVRLPGIYVVLLFFCCCFFFTWHKITRWSSANISTYPGKSVSPQTGISGFNMGFSSAFLTVRLLDEPKQKIACCFS